MNPTNESIGRAFSDALAQEIRHVDGNHSLGAAALADALTPFIARELGRQAPGDGYTYGHCDEHKRAGGCQRHNLQCGYPDCDRQPIAAPQPPAPRVTQTMVDDQRRIVEELRAIRELIPQPPAPAQGGDLPVVADYTPVTPEEEAEIDAALGLVKVRMRVPADLHRELVADSEDRGLVLAAVIRERLACPAVPEDGSCTRHECKRIRIEMQTEIDRLRNAVPEDAARDAERFRWLCTQDCGIGHIKFGDYADYSYSTVDSPSGRGLRDVCDDAIASQAEGGANG